VDKFQFFYEKCREIGIQVGVIVVVVAVVEAPMVVKMAKSVDLGGH